MLGIKTGRFSSSKLNYSVQPRSGEDAPPDQTRNPKESEDWLIIRRDHQNQNEEAERNDPPSGDSE